MSVSRLLSEKLSSFEKYNNKELYNFGSGSFSSMIMSRLIPGNIGFIALNDSIDYTISLTYFTLNFENIREIVEI